ELMSCDAGAVEVATIAKDLGLNVRCAFLDFWGVTNPDREGITSIDQTVEFASKIGLDFVVFGYITREERSTINKLKGIAERTNQAGEKFKDAGIQLAYHNHAFEFEKLGGKQSAMELFEEEFDPDLVKFELDVFWAAIAGQDPLAWMKRLDQRLALVHLKDLLAGTPTIFDEGQVPKDAFQELGDGQLDMPAIMRLAKDLGVVHCHVEQDQSPDPIKSIVQSRRYLG
ncbi:MAG: sugar phosphate isomerase/epimerase family protein, partial [Planctomycetota bacterium]